LKAIVVPKSTLRTRRHRALIAVLVELRKEKQLTQRELAARLGVPQNYIAQIESGLRRVDVVEFTEYVNALGEEPVELYGRVLSR
jgi:transcriptional regulator with XRE-family HTH domain